MFIHQYIPLAISQNLCALYTTTATDDFAPQNPLTITFPPRSVPPCERCLQYQIVGDDFKEVDETFTINVVAENRFDFIQGPSNILVTIQNDQDCES